MAMSGTKLAPVDYYLDQVLRRAEAGMVTRYVELAMSNELVFVASAHRHLVSAVSSKIPAVRLAARPNGFYK